MPDKPPIGDPLLIHEGSLAGKVARGSEAGDLVDQQLLHLGTQLVSQLNVLLRTLRSHGRSNTALERPVAAICRLVEALGYDEPVSLRVQEGFVFLGQRHLRISTGNLPIFASFMDALSAADIGALVLKRGVTGPELRRFAELFVAVRTGEDGTQKLRAGLGAASIASIAVEPPRAMRKDDEAGGGVVRGPGAAGGPASAVAHARSLVRQRARSAYARADAAAAQLSQSARQGGKIHFRHAKRAIQNIVDLLLKDPATVLGLTTLRAHDEYTQNHSVNVAVLAMALANRAGYAKVELADVGLAALFHDVGKCAVPLEILNKPAEFTADEWAVMRTHPSEGVIALVGARGIDKVPARMASAAFEHHLAFNATGYPKLTSPWKQSLCSRVVAVADCYDAMTSARVYTRQPVAPANALRYMLGRAGSQFDPTMLKYFVTCVGIIPIGSLVMLDSGELAVVTRPPVDKEHADRPEVKVIAAPDGTPAVPAPEHDLRELTPQGTYARSIVRLIDNTEYHLETARWLSTGSAS